MTQSQLKNNVIQLLSNVKRACDATGRNVDDIFICAASKTQDLDTIKSLDELNMIQFIGENRVQEFLEKDCEFKHLHWHFIGQLQTNKVKYIVGKVDLIHSVDRLSLLEKINSVASEKNVIQDVLIEVNVAGEESKGGASLSELFDIVDKVVNMKNVHFRGLMTVMPKTDDKQLSIYYNELSKTYKKLKELYPNEKITYLSAGMSGDYELAIRYGANLIRVGTAIFGQRTYISEGDGAKKEN